MSAQRKIDKLEKKVRKLRTQLTLSRSDLLIEMESYKYRAVIAEAKVISLTDDVDALKAKLAILQRISPKEPDATDTRAESTDTSTPLAEVIARPASDDGSAPVAEQAG